MPKFREINQQNGFPLFTQDKSTAFLVSGQKLRVTELWGLWHYILKGHLNRYGKKNVDYPFLLSLIEQAEYFYKAASDAPLKSRPLLYYYSFLNAAKAFITLKDSNWHSSGLDYFHGIESCPISAATGLRGATVQVRSLVENDGSRKKISVANILSRDLGDNVERILPPVAGHDNGPWNFSVLSLFQACIGIHRTVSETFKEKEHFVRLINPTLYKSGRNLQFKAELTAMPATRASLINAGYRIVHDSNTNRSWIEFEDIALNYALSKPDYHNFATKINEQGVWYYSTLDDHRLYISPKGFIKKAGEDFYSLGDRGAGINHLHLSSGTIIYYLMFFLGSITRYHPYLFESMLSDKEIWMISEFLNTQPYQFINILVSKLLSVPVYGSRMPET